MKIEVKRTDKGTSYTMGQLYVDGELICDTLEDVDRNLNQHMSEEVIRQKKVYGETAIPRGTYSVTLNVFSSKFGSLPFYKETCGGKLPRLLNVPGYEGVLIHVGKRVENTLGCILVGKKVGAGHLDDGKAAFKKLWDKIKGGKDITISVS